MAPKFGSYLFRNLKGQTPEANQGTEGAFGPFEEQPIVLRREDVRSDDPKGPLLDWSKVESGQVTLRLSQTQGIGSGCVTVKASTLQQICPQLLPSSFDPEYSFPVFLKSVVMQIQAHLQRKLADRPRTEGPDFDTPIAQVAREDEGFFKLEKVARQPPEMQNPKRPADARLPASEGLSFPLIREREVSEKPGSEPPPLEVVLPPPAPREAKTPSQFTGALFDDLPKVGAAASPKEPAVAGPSGGNEEEAAHLETARKAAPAPAMEDVARKPPRRAGVERLQEIFMTEDLLDAGEVAALIARFPKVKGALILSDEGAVMGGTLPADFNTGAVALVPAVFHAIQGFGKQLKEEDSSACTIFLEQPVSLCSAGKICILIVHEGKGFLPGMRSRICEIAGALDMLYGKEKGALSS